MTQDTRIRHKNTTRDDKKQEHARLCESNHTLITKMGRWEMPRERIAELKGDAITLVYYEHADYLLATLWCGTSHVIIPRYPLLRRTCVRTGWLGCWGFTLGTGHLCYLEIILPRILGTYKPYLEHITILPDSAIWPIAISAGNRNNWAKNNSGPDTNGGCTLNGK